MAALNTKSAVLRGSQLSDTTTDLNVSTATALAWNTSQDFNTNYFSFAGGNPSRLVVEAAGDYLVSVTVPITSDAASGSDRNGIMLDVRVNGSKVELGIGASTYIRNATQQESSGHLSVLLKDLSESDYIEAFVVSSTNETTNTLTSNTHTLCATYVEENAIFSATGTETTDSTNLNQATPYALEWSAEVRKDSGFTHSTMSSPEEITLNTAGLYLVLVNVSLNGAVTRANVRGEVLLDGTPVPHAVMTQGYIRNANAHEDASIHYYGLVETTGSDQVLSVTTEEDAASGTITVGSDKATITIIKLADNTGFFSATATQVGSSSDDWNPASASPVLWVNELEKDSGSYTHDTGSNPDQITVSQPGDYLVGLNIALTQNSSARSNVKAKVLVNGTPVAGLESKSSYIRISGHVTASNALLGVLPALSASDVVTVTVEREGATPSVDDDAPASVFLYKLPPAGTETDSDRAAAITGSNDGWKIERKKDAGAWETIEEAIVIEESGGTYNYTDDSALTDGSTYCYRVTQVVDESTVSNEDCVAFSLGTETQSERSVETTGSQEETSGRSAKIIGKNIGSTERDTIVDGEEEAIAERSVEAHGQDISTSNRPVETTGAEATNNDRATTVEGFETASADRSGETHGRMNAAAEKPSTVEGISSAPADRASSAHGFDTTDSERAGEVTGSEHTTAESSAIIDGSLGGNSQRSIEVHGLDTDSSEQAATVHGSIDVDADRPGHVDGQATDVSNRGAKVHGTADDTDQRSGSVEGTATDESEHASKVSGVDTSNAERSGETHGKDTSVSPRATKTEGVDTTQEDRNASTQGADSAASERSLETHGADEAQSELAAQVSGADAANSEHSAAVFGVLSDFSERGAETTGVFSSESVRAMKVGGRVIRRLKQSPLTTTPNRNTLSTSRRNRHTLRTARSTRTVLKSKKANRSTLRTERSNKHVL